MIDKNAYMLKIARSGPVRLVVLNFEIIIDYLGVAIESAPHDDVSCRAAVNKAKEGVEKLIQALDFEVPMSHDFYEIYKYVYGLLSTAAVSSDSSTVLAKVEEVKELTGLLLASWQKTAEIHIDEPVNENAPKIYAGLTYGRGGKLNEYIDEDSNRGFKA